MNEEKGFWQRKMSRQKALQCGLLGLAGVAGAASVGYGFLKLPGMGKKEAVMSKKDFAEGEIWKLWQKRGWAREGMHYSRLGDDAVECDLCPNKCVLELGDRGRCHNRVNVDGKLYTLVYGNPCSFHIDPIEKKPLMHFLPTSDVFSIATSGCCLRCMNCQNWTISQMFPEEMKDVHGPELRLTPKNIVSLTRQEVARASMFPEDVIRVAEHFKCPSIAYTYSEPTIFYEYMHDTAKLAREKGIKNVWVTCGYMQPEVLEEYCAYLDAANVDLKSFDEKIYKKLNSGRLSPVLETLKILKKRGVWFEVTNLIVPTYTDDLEMIRKMCEWLMENIGPDYPLHFSRFHPAHKLTHLPATPLETLSQAREIARETGLRYVYIGNARGVKDAEMTFCPKCGKTVIERDLFSVKSIRMKGNKCESCGETIAGVWSV